MHLAQLAVGKNISYIYKNMIFIDILYRFTGQQVLYILNICVSYLLTGCEV